MKTIELTKGFVALVDDADFERVSAFKWRAYVDKNTVYAIRHARKPDGKETTQYMHRFITGVTDPKVKVDHRNGNGLDNQQENLRPCTNQQNCASQHRIKGGSSKFKGVVWRGRSGKFEAQIKPQGRCIYIGMFVDEVDAALAYDAAAREHFGQFAVCNFPN